MEAMRDLQHFLADNGEGSWAADIERAANSVAKADAYGLKKFISMFGGMGTLNDLVLYRDDNILMSENEKLDQLRSRA